MTQEKIRTLFNYNKDTGVLSRIAYKNRAITAKTKNGYITTQIDGKNYMAHRIIYLYITGIFPETVDHINQNRADNRWSNLRSVSVGINNKNKSMYKNNTSSTMGVYFMKSKNKWVARIKVNSRPIHLGLHKKKEDAIKARLHAEKLYGFHENHGAQQSETNNNGCG